MGFALTMFIGAIAANRAAERQQRSFNDDRVVAEVRIRTTTTLAWIWATVCTALLGGGHCCLDLRR